MGMPGDGVGAEREEQLGDNLEHHQGEHRREVEHPPAEARQDPAKGSQDGIGDPPDHPDERVVRVQTGDPRHEHPDQDDQSEDVEEPPDQREDASRRHAPSIGTGPGGPRRGVAPGAWRGREVTSRDKVPSAPDVAPRASAVRVDRRGSSGEPGCLSFSRWRSRPSAHRLPS